MRFNTNDASLLDRIVSVLSYISFGMAGMVWLFISILVLKKPLPQFAAYHIYQSIFLSIFLYILSVLYDIMFNLTANLPFVGQIIYSFDVVFNKMPIFHTLTMSGVIIIAIIIYLSLGSILGKYVYLPFVSDVINSNFRR